MKPVWEGINKKNTLGLAAQMAFWVFLALIPLAAVVGLVAARVAIAHNQDVLAPVMQSVPGPVQRLILEQLDHVAKWNTGAVAPLAIGVFVWLAASGVHSVFDAIEAQTETCRPWWKKRLYAIGFCVVMSIGVAAVGLLASGFKWIVKLVGAQVPAWMGSAFEGIVRVALALAVAFAMICALYWVGLPPHARKRMRVAPGAAVALGLQIAMGFGYGVYVAHMGTGDAYQAGLAVVGVTLILLYLYSLAILVGAELNRVLGEKRADARGRGTALAASDPSCSPSRASSSRPTSPSRPIAPLNTPSRSPSG